MYFYSKNEQFLLLPRTPGLPRSPGSQGCPRGCPQGCPGVALTLRLGVLGVGGGFTFLSVRKRGEGIFWLVVSVPGPRLRLGVDIYIGPQILLAHFPDLRRHICCCRKRNQRTATIYLYIYIYMYILFWTIFRVEPWKLGSRKLRLNKMRKLMNEGTTRCSFGTIGTGSFRRLGVFLFSFGRGGGI